jgi:hypothetical protein
MECTFPVNPCIHLQCNAENISNCIVVIFFINSISNCYEEKESRRMFCYDGYGSDPENWKKLKCFSGFCVKIISSSNERQYCKTGSHATECIYDYIYCIVASTSPSRIEAHAGLFRSLMKRIFDPYVL